MYAKLAIRNIRRSVRDYAIYFVTLLFGVAVFYAFNSISSQQVLFDLEAGATSNIFDATEYFMGLFSILIACVLGFLIIYSNRFLIRRRKHEFGIYLTLGMTPGGVSRIVLYEAILVGLVSLAVGLTLGFILSQLLSFATAALFGITMTHYQFVFSTEALIKTLISFTVIYVVVALFNTLTVNRLPLIQLLSAESRNERNPVHNPWICLVVFIISLVVIGFSYQTLIDNGLVNLDAQFALATILMLVGTLLFFWSLAGFVIALLQRLRNVYFRKLRVFTVRQIASKVNTAFLSLWAVCVLLFFSITTFSTGMGFVELFAGSINEANPFDVTIRTDYVLTGSYTVGPEFKSAEERAQVMAETEPELYAEAKSFDFDMAALFAAQVPCWSEVVKASTQLNFWRPTNLSLGMMIEDITGAPTPAGMEANKDIPIDLLAITDFNNLRRLVGEASVTLNDDQCLIVNNFAATDSIAQDAVEKQTTLDILGHSLTFTGPVYRDQLQDMSTLSTVLVVVVPDMVIEPLKAEGGIPYYSYLDIDFYRTDQASDREFLRGIYDAYHSPGVPAFELLGPYDSGITTAAFPISQIIMGAEMRSQAGGLRMLITYLALYIGFVLLVSTAAILAIQQLSETVDSLPRYRTLSRLGCDAPMLNRSLLAQVLVYFLLPLGLAICHSVCAIWVITQTALGLGINAGGAIALAAVLVVVVYGSYLLITYLASRSILKGATKPA